MTETTQQEQLRAATKRITELETKLASLDQHCILRDLENHEAQARLIQYERIISTTPDLIALVDTEHRFHMVNVACADNFQQPREDITGLHIADLIGTPFYESMVKERLDRALGGETITMEHWYKLPKAGDRYMATTFQPISVSGMDIDYIALESRDITELKVKEEDLLATARRLDMATDAGNIGIWERDLQTNGYYWDKKMHELHRVAHGEFESVHQGWKERVHKEDYLELERQMAQSIETLQRFDMEYRLVCPDGDIRNVKIAGSVQLNDQGAPVHLTGVSWDVTGHRRMEEELRRLASTDPLTGANNRRHFMESLKAELERSKRYGTELVLLSLDIDHFKDINDTYGHPVGDKVLKELVSLCTHTLRTTDLFGRVGGEEFMAALPQTGAEAGQQTAERLRKAVEYHFVDGNGTPVTFTISIGLTELQGTDEIIDSLLHRADEALYKAKRNGRNRIEVV